MTQNRVNGKNIIVNRLSTSTNSVVTCSTPIPTDNTIPQNTEGDQVLSLTITPQNANTKLLIEFYAQVMINATSNYSTIALFQDSNVNALAAAVQRQYRDNVLRYVMTSGTTSATTFKIRAGPNTASSIYMNADSTGAALMGGVSFVWFRITEYLG